MIMLLNPTLKGSIDASESSSDKDSVDLLSNERESEEPKLRKELFSSLSRLIAISFWTVSFEVSLLNWKD